MCVCGSVDRRPPVSPRQHLVCVRAGRHGHRTARAIRCMTVSLLSPRWPASAASTALQAALPAWLPRAPCGKRGLCEGVGAVVSRCQQVSPTQLPSTSRRCQVSTHLPGHTPGRHHPLATRLPAARSACMARGQRSRHRAGGRREPGCVRVCAVVAVRRPCPALYTSTHSHFSRLYLLLEPHSSLNGFARMHRWATSTPVCPRAAASPTPAAILDGRTSSSSSAAETR